MAKSLNSLTARITLLSLIVLPLLLGFSAYSLDKAYLFSLEKAEQQSLRGQLYLLLGASEPQGNELTLPSALPEPRFNTPQSGLFAFVADADHNIVWHSDSSPSQLNQIRTQSSISDAALLASLEPQNEPELFTEVALEKNRFYQLRFDSVWELETGDQAFRFVIFHDASETETELLAYRKALAFWLGGLALLLILAQLLITFWGLYPLKRLATDLSIFQQGNKKRLDGNYPSEISPVTHNLNSLLESEQAQRERYKNTMADLAHSLKTPLAVMRATLANREHSDPATTSRATTHERDRLIDEQISRMSSIIQHQLQRATLRTTHTSLTSVSLQEVVRRLTSALTKVYREKQFTVDVDISEQLMFPGDEGDALEMLGNIIENAFKYGRNTIGISAYKTSDALMIFVEDNGSGIGSLEKKEILTRGARADTSTQGQGIGLAITLDMLASYGGSLEVLDSGLGGAKFCISIPI
ncbi:ATP-binding protein [Teredinibacter waterburyi]|jgi:Signal transduction histidine kinase|uniref:ATP-binding protein n=1 Tax=Teredinibacter waterburyi TaxID=1500538 RepID=UPI00165F661D|nr:ATP-binding protein [Teredinibacter waterburyi]